MLFTPGWYNYFKCCLRIPIVSLKLRQFLFLALFAPFNFLFEIRTIFLISNNLGAIKKQAPE